MKIISKFKDLYDHKVAKYGVDPILVFDRRQAPGSEILHSLPKPLPQWQQEYGACAAIAELYIGNLLVYLFVTANRVYTSYDIQSIGRRTPQHRTWQYFVCFRDGSEFSLPQCDNHYGHYWHRQIDTALFAAQESPRSNAALASHREVPLLLVYYADLHRPNKFASHQDYATNPQLSALGVYIDPDIVWQRIVEYLSQLKSEAETSPRVPDQDKIGNKGFDAKYSFRPNMKRKSS